MMQRGCRFPLHMKPGLVCIALDASTTAFGLTRLHMMQNGVPSFFAYLEIGYKHSCISVVKASHDTNSPACLQTLGIPLELTWNSGCKHHCACVPACSAGPAAAVRDCGQLMHLHVHLLLPPSTPGLSRRQHRGCFAQVLGLRVGSKGLEFGAPGFKVQAMAGDNIEAALHRQREGEGKAHSGSVALPV
eukprot:1158803-Pelagomonas_calceolata.AAC.2